MEGLVSVRSFRAADCFSVKGRGTVWTGLSPFKFVRDSGWQEAFAGLWKIDHPLADPNKVYEVIAVESHCVPVIREGAPIGILVREVTLE